MLMRRAQGADEHRVRPLLTPSAAALGVENQLPAAAKRQADRIDQAELGRCVRLHHHPMPGPRPRL
ncbi:MAG: hypothetical protein ACK51T_02430, partial [bacterium]